MHNGALVSHAEHMGSAHNATCALDAEGYVVVLITVVPCYAADCSVLFLHSSQQHQFLTANCVSASDT